MCRNIKVLFNFEPPATHDEIRAAATQFVRKVSGATKPSRANAPAFELALEDVTNTVHHLLDTLVTSAPSKDRDVEAEKARGNRKDLARLKQLLESESGA